VDPATIAELLRPFLTAPLSATQLANISTFIDILLRWNAHLNLTAVRRPEEIVTRHFGESLFAARHLFPAKHVGTAKELANDQRPPTTDRLIDIGSGAGFPGLPIKLWAPEIHLTLIESNQKKATFLREVTRTVTLTNVDVFAGRAEDFLTNNAEEKIQRPSQAEVVTLRAVERFDNILPIAASLVASQGRLALLIGKDQATRARALVPDFLWPNPISIPQSDQRTLLVGSRSQRNAEPFSIRT
jgi:16S rRNA (guanine527-N7)-methyltransferase